VADVWEAIERHQAHLGKAGIEKARRARRRAELGTALAALIRRQAGKALETGLGAELAASVERGDTDPWTAADQLAAV
jgi:putative protein kinase ArgK-like GTPase of G3E family